jgi:hypothetical protein
MKRLGGLIGMVFLVGCGIGNKIDVPNRIDTVVSGETTSHIIHTVEISAQLEQIFRAECESLAIQAGLQRDTPPFETFVATCVAEKSKKFMDDFLTFIQSQQSQQEEEGQVDL